MVRKSTLGELVTDPDKPKPIKMVEMPKNLADMTDEQIEAFAAKIWDGWITDNADDSKDDSGGK